MDCIFCKIAKDQIPADKIYEDDSVIAFKDVNPVAPVHVLVIPKEHVCCAENIDCSNKDLVGDIFCAIAKIANDLGLKNGYRIINNCGEDGGQTVKHLHFHLIGGKKLGWPQC